MSDFDRAKNLLIGAVDTVLSLATQSKPSVEPPSARESSSSSVRPPSSQSRTSQQPATAAQNATIEEHRRLFGYKPRKGKRSRKDSAAGTSRRKGKGTWKKDCICLRDKEQTMKPTSEEKIELAKMGLGLGEVRFNTDGDAEHIHSVLLAKFPVLESCGGYTLMRLGENSHHMVEIEGPDSGMTVSFLKDILNQAKLYIRPLQKDITDDDMKEYSNPLESGTEPTEFCQTCDSLLPLSQLRKHILTCSQGKNEQSGISTSCLNEDPYSPTALSPELPSSFHKTEDYGASVPLNSERSVLPSAKRPCFDVAQDPNLKQHDDSPSSPMAPSPEPLSPVLQQREYGSTTYSSFVNLISDDESEWVKDPAVQVIIQQTSKEEKSNSQNMTIEEILKKHRCDVLYEDEDNVHRITVRRGNILKDAVFALRQGFDSKKHIRVRFIGEPAVDAGGPRREFFMLLMNAIANSASLLQGPPDRRLLRHNTSAFQDELYLYVGQIIALSILNGGPGPVFFAPVIIDYLFGGISAVKPTVSDVPDEDVQVKIRKLAETTSAADFKEMISDDEYDFRFNCGISKPSCRIQFSDKQKTIDAMCLHYTVLSCLAELEQLRRGLAMQKFNSLMESFPEILRKVFCPSLQPITSEMIQDLFVANFSPVGSNNRAVEEALLMTWVHYLDNIEDQGTKASPTLNDVMVFLTGCDSVPPLGFGDVTPHIAFVDDSVLPTVSTCSLKLTIPRNFPAKFDEFKEKMDFSILGSQGFFGSL